MSLPPSTVDLWEQVTGGLLVEGYGMTETSPVTLGNPVAGTRRPGTVGVPFPSTDIRIVDPHDTTVDRGARGAGRAARQGPAGVLRLLEPAGGHRATVLLDGGWIRTGDIVVMDDDGFVRIVDRIKELIITGGFNVYPSEVEDALRRIPGRAGRRGRRPAARVRRRDRGGRGGRRTRGAARPRGGARRVARAPHRLQGAAPGVRARGAAALAHRQGAAPAGARRCSRQHPDRR